MARQASVLVCDEILFNLQGKAFLQGIYTGDIIIAESPSTVPQLIFYLMVETDTAEPFGSLLAEITLPERPPISLPLPIVSMVPVAGRAKFMLKWPVPVSLPELHPGKIIIKLIHESGELLIAGPWIVQAARAPEKSH